MYVIKCFTPMLAALVVGICVLAVPPASAEESKEDVCRNLAKKAERALWDGFRESADELFCRKPWVKRKSHELLACGLTDTTNLLANKIKSRWNRFFDKADAEWATWGPRGFGEEWEEGTIRGGVKRSFFGPALAYNKSTVEVAKEGGRAKAFVTVCELDYDGNVVSSHRRSFPQGKGNEGMTRTFAIENTDTRILGVVVDTGFSVNSFEYRTRIVNEAIRNDFGPVRGIADLHVHQFVDLAFGGRMYWGAHSGDKRTALDEEVITGSLNPVADNLLIENALRQVTRPGVDANVLLWIANHKPDDEGFVQLGGRGYPDYRDWPDHADRSHQQVHVSWVQEAHARGKESGANLSLLVVSVVNNNILCSALKTVDPYGNVPERNSAGEMIKNKWTSASWGCSDHENVLRQLKAIHALENEYSWYRVAMTPWHARQIIADGDLAVVVSLETDKPLSSEGGNYGNVLQQLDEYRAMGLTTLQVVHESNSKFCGAAPHRGMMQALQAVHWPLKSLTNVLRSAVDLPFSGFSGSVSTFNKDAEGYNALGLTKEGEELVDALVRRHLPIDLAHGSQRCRKGIMNRVPEGYGLYDSHTKFQRLLDPSNGPVNYGTDVLKREKEFLITESILPDYLQHQVLVGLRTASVDVYDAPNAKVDNDCPGSAKSFAQLVQYAHDSGLKFAYGTDFNTGVSQLGARFGPDRCWAWKVDERKDNEKRPLGAQGRVPQRARAIEEIDGTNYYQDGLATIGWLPELTRDLIDLGTPGAPELKRSAEAYLAMWQRAYDAGLETASNTTTSSNNEPQSKALGLACNRDDECGSGKCSSIAGARGTCVCNEDEDCGNGKFCDMGADVKVNACRALKADNESCAAVNGARTCQGGRCQWGRCYTQASVSMGETCYVNDACAQGKCSSVNGTKGTCVCDADPQCGKGFWCNKGIDLNKNTCKAKLAKGDVCGTVGELKVGHRCKSGTCTAILTKPGKLTCK